MRIIGENCKHLVTQVLVETRGLVGERAVMGKGAAVLALDPHPGLFQQAACLIDIMLVQPLADLPVFLRADFGRDVQLVFLRVGGHNHSLMIF